MNAKRIAAIIGLVAIMASILCMILGGVLPAWGELLLSLSGLFFLIGAATFGMIMLKKKEQEAAQNPDDDQQGK